MATPCYASIQTLVLLKLKLDIFILNGPRRRRVHLIRLVSRDKQHQIKRRVQKLVAVYSVIARWP